MNTNLCIDWGNTRVKAAIFNDDKIEKEFNCSHQEAEAELLNVTAQYKPERTILSSVGRISDGFKNELGANTKLMVLDSNTPIPFMNAYQSPRTLGADRLAMVAAAQALYPNETSLSISVGTAITYNLLQKGLIFRGGNITAGAQLRLQALNEHTANLPLIDIRGDQTLLGFSTEACIRNGAIWGLAAEIEGMIDFYKEQYSCNNVVITGGDYPLLAKKLKNKIFAAPQLVLNGLNLILKHNA